MLTTDQAMKELLSEPHHWLVTGCAGFIGSHLTAFLLNHNQRVTGIDNLSSCGRVNLDYLIKIFSADKLKNFTFNQGDIRDIPSCLHVVEGGLDYLLHHAAIGSVKASFDDPRTTHEINTKGFENIVRTALKNGVQKIIYASSSAVYGDSDTPINKESQALNPLSPYAQSKIDNEESAKKMFEEYQRPIIGLRYFNIYGARQNPNGDYAAVIPKWIEGRLLGQAPIIYGDGSAVRDFCYIDDIIRLNILAAIYGEGTETYNGASGESTTVNELEQLIRSSLGTNKPPIYKPARNGDIHTSIADITKAQNDLRFSAQTDIRTGIAETIKFFTSLKKDAA